MKNIVRVVLGVLFFVNYAYAEFECNYDSVSDDNYIVVEKQGVTYKFVKFDEATDHFVNTYFEGWESETFEAFDKVKDKEGIAVDIGGWIGTTAIWLSHNFHHVVVVEPDRTSLECLRMNLNASKCPNVSICEQAVAGTEQEVIFGPRGSVLNESMSYIKDKISNENDYAVKSITLKQLCNDYVYDNDDLNSRNISFIKCDIEGGEEDILEDVLQFAYDNKCSVYMSFHLDWWKSKKIADFDHLFNRFKTNCPIVSVSEYVTKNPFASVLFEPLANIADLDCQYDQTLVVVLMVKNEETVMGATLQPFIDGGVDSFFIFDTGSTDNTIAVTEEFFAKNGITQGYIVQEPFIDFATSRNRALDLAQEKFPNAAFMVMPDAEWYLNDARALVEFCELCLRRGDVHTSYMMHIVNQALDNYTCRLFRCNRDVRFFGVVHEVVPQVLTIRVPGTIYFEYLPESNGVEKTAQRFIRDRQLLLKEHLSKPWCTRTLFYLARTCEDLGNWEEAYNFYKIRVDMVGWDEEDFIVRYRLAETIKKLILRSEHAHKYTWSEAMDYYLQAYQMRPHRIEPIVGIADYYVALDQMHLAFLFARRAAEMEYPAKDVLFVEKYLYTYYRYELLARCAWYINEFKIGAVAARKAYEAYPDYKYAKINMECYAPWQPEPMAV
jgi:FkbM family methyltransferase